MHLLISNSILLLSGHASAATSTGGAPALGVEGQPSNDEGNGSSNAVDNHPIGKLPSISFLFYFYLYILQYLFSILYHENYFFFLFFMLQSIYIYFFLQILG